MRSAGDRQHELINKALRLLKNAIYPSIKDLYKEGATPDVVADARKNMSNDQVDRYGTGNLKDSVEFHEFHGGDGQMGVAGDKTSGLDKSEFQTSEIAATGSAYTQEFFKQGKRAPLKKIAPEQRNSNQKVKTKRKVGKLGSFSSKSKAEKLNAAEGNIKGTI